MKKAYFSTKLAFWSGIKTEVDKSGWLWKKGISLERVLPKPNSALRQTDKGITYKIILLQELWLFLARLMRAAFFELPEGRAEVQSKRFQILP